MKIEIIPNRHILASARAFYKSAKILNNNEFPNDAIPIIVNSAFALELYLKAFNSKKIFKNGKETSEGITIYESVISKASSTGREAHKLHYLYNDLNDKIKEIIEREHSEANESLEEVILEFNNLFVEWRYSFEGSNKSVNITKMFYLLEIFENSALALEKSN